MRLGFFLKRGAALDPAQRRSRASPRWPRCSSRCWCSASSSRSCRRPPARPTRCAAACSLDVYMQRDATSSDLERVRRAHQRRHAARQEGRVRLQGAGLQAGAKNNPEAYKLLGSNPLPDTFRVTPDDPDNIGSILDALAPRNAAGGTRQVVDPAIERCATSKDETDKILTATQAREAGDGRRSTSLLVLAIGAADLEHDPAVAVLAPPRGRGDEARRRDRLVHPLAVHDRGRRARRARRR